MSRSSTVILMILLGISIAGFFILNLLLGSVHIPFDEIMGILLGRNDGNVIWTNIILKSRLPQSLTAMMAGAGLAVSGLLMQTVFRNPLAGPSVLGISSGASLGVACVVLLSGSIGGVVLSKLGVIGEVTITLSAIVGSLLIMALIAFVAQKVRGNVTLLIMGVMIGYIANAIIGVLKFFSVHHIDACPSANVLFPDKDPQSSSVRRLVRQELRFEHQEGETLGYRMFGCAGRRSDSLLWSCCLSGSCRSAYL